MWIKTASFAAGVFLCQQLSVLPGILWGLAGLVGSFFIVRQARFAFAGFALLGFCWAMISGHWALQDRLPAGLIKQKLEIGGQIVDLPVRQGQGWRFNFSVKSAFLDKQPVELPDKIRLSWYHSDAELLSGQSWRFTVKLKPPVGTLNPGVFDYESWLFQQGIGATGYVLNDRHSKLTGQAGWLSGFGFFREKLRSGLRSYEIHHDAVAVMQALAVGDKSAISQPMWEMFRRAGINHLVAISGLHIGMIALTAYWLSGFAWRRSAYLCELITAPRIQSISSILAAAAYAGLAGFSIPTQRALIMLLVIMLARLLLVNLPASRQLSIAVFVVLLLDPVAITSPGFWLSFIAVIAIYLVIEEKVQVSKVRQLVRMQWSVSLWLMPFSLFWFNQVSLISPLVNMMLVPLFSVFIVPVTLLLTLMNQWPLTATRYLTGSFIAFLHNGLQSLQHVTAPSWISYATTSLKLSEFLLLLLAAAAWFLPGKFLFRPVSVLLILIVLFNSTQKDIDTDFSMTLLDVGQGLSVFIEQGGKTLLYDLGPRYSGSASATASIVVPFLSSRGVTSIDKLVISHADSDHAGDIETLHKHIMVSEIIAGETVGYDYGVKKMPVWRWLALG